MSRTRLLESLEPEKSIRCLAVIREDSPVDAEGVLG